ncbi:MAG: glutamine amidotransferase, partial [Planctomycetota bacterium]|nr:glutamine amidotransferase [Planctomycetota bacterium]
MTDRLILWLVGLAPLLTMVGVLLCRRWYAVPRPNVRKELIITLLVLAGLAAVVAWDLSRGNVGVVAHVRLQRPVLLLALVPLYGLLLLLQSYTLSGIARGRMWTAFVLRATMLNLLLLALAGLQMVIEQDTLTVIYALDVSKSVPLSERQRALDFVKKSLPGKRADDKVGLLVFGGRAEWEISPTPLFAAPDARNIKATAMPDATNIEAAFQRALARSDDDARRRVVMFTDGRQTAGDAPEELKRVVSNGVDVWIVPLQRGDDPEMLIEKVVLPSELLWEQPFDVHVFVHSNVSATRARVHLYTGDKASPNPPPQTVPIVPGKNRITFKGLKMRSGGAKEVRAVLEPLKEDDGAVTDTLSENNEAYAFTDVQTDNRVLIMTSSMDEVKYLLAALEGEKMTLDVRAGTSLPDNPEAYRAYDCIVLANLARGFLSEQQMKVIETCVKDQGAGLVMIGGDQSFGAGGYLQTPIEDALPVQMDLKNQRVMPSGALCIVLHTCEFPDGNAWGKKISKAAIKVLSPQDYAGLIYYGNFGGESWCFKPAPVRPQMFQLIDNCEPGDMPSLDTIVSMAVTSLVNLNNVSLKHCIVISDGDPSGPTPSTLAAAKRGSVTVSTISIYPHGGMEVDTLKRVAAETGGRFYSADDPRKLPQIFIKEAAVVRKSLIRSDEKGIPIALGTAGTTLKDFGTKFPDVTAFVVTAPKDRAELQLYTTVEGEKLPILMSWHYGLGKAVAFTSDSTNRWAADWVKWPSYNKFWTNLLSWVSRQRMPSNHTVTTRIEGDTAHVVVEGLDAKGDYINFAKLTGNAIDPEVARNGPDGRTYELNFSMTAPGRYEAAFPVQKAGAYAITIVDQSNPAKPNTIITGLANSYSPEFLHLEGDEALLAKLGEIATGKDKVSHLKDLARLDPLKCSVYAHDLPPARQPADLFWPLLLAALCIFPLDVAIRRLALDPEKAFLFVWARLAPLLGRLRLKKKQLQDAAVE